MRVTEDDTDLGRGETLAGELEDVVADLVRGDFEPPGSGALVREGRAGWAGGGRVSEGEGEEMERGVPIPLWGLCLGAEGTGQQTASSGRRGSRGLTCVPS